MPNVPMQRIREDGHSVDSSESRKHGMQVWVVDDGRVATYDGDFNEFRDELSKEIQAELDEAERAAAARAAERAAAKKAAAKR